MLAPSLAKFGPLGVKEFEVFDLPFVFDDYTALHKVTQGPIGKKLLSRLEPKGILGLAYWDNGFKVLDWEMRAVGAIPQVMAFSEVYQALQTGVVDGTENPPSNLYTQKMHEVQKYVTLSNHGYLGYAVIVNKKFWNDLPADIRAQLDGALAQATVFANEVAKKDNDEALAAVKKSGRSEFVALTPQERTAWKTAMDKTHTEQASRIGAELIQEVYRETGYKAN